MFDYLKRIAKTLEEMSKREEKFLKLHEEQAELNRRWFQELVSINQHIKVRDAAHESREEWRFKHDKRRSRAAFPGYENLCTINEYLLHEAGESLRSVFCATCKTRLGDVEDDKIAELIREHEEAKCWIKEAAGDVRKALGEVSSEE